jgi:ADP-ribosyl-[dinitrogen reductase] hydrolase
MTAPLSLTDRANGVAVGAALGDAFGMPLEFGPAIPPDRLVRDLRPGRLPAGSFTDDTEMALALADSLLACQPLSGDDLAQRFLGWYHAGPPDVGIHTRSVLNRVQAGQPWKHAADAVQEHHPESAGNGSIMRCWPVALADWNNLEKLIDESRLQSRVTHAHIECMAASAFVNLVIAGLLAGATPAAAVESALARYALPPELLATVRSAPATPRADLRNSGWVRHTLQSAVWGLLTTASYAEAVIQVANLGNDADTAASVVGALAGAAYGLSGIPAGWQSALRGEWPLGSGQQLNTPAFVALVGRLTDLTA